MKEINWRKHEAKNNKTNKILRTQDREQWRKDGKTYKNERRVLLEEGGRIVNYFLRVQDKFQITHTSVLTNRKELSLYIKCGKGLVKQTVPFPNLISKQNIK